MEHLREILITAAGAVGGALSWLFGGFNDAMIVLIVFMALDYASGLIVAGVFHNSGKSESGAIESRAGFKGLCRKGAALAIVMMAALLDRALGTACVKDAVIIGFIVNEGISILENAGLMGVNYPKAIKNALELLREQTEKDATKLTETEETDDGEGE